MCGSWGMTGSVTSESEIAFPYRFVAVTASRNVEPTSDIVGWYSVFVAPLMSWHAPPVASQRCHCCFVTIGASPVKVPMLADRTPPTSSVPTISGASLDVGAKCGLSTTGNVWFVTAVSVPARFEPTIQTRIAAPMSATTGMYVAAVAPGIWTQLGSVPCGSHRRHEYVNVSGVVPSQVPEVSASVWPTMTVPVICGVTRRRGAISPTGCVDSEFCATAPAEFVAVTSARIVSPYRSGVTVNVLRVAPTIRKQFPVGESHFFH